MNVTAKVYGAYIKAPVMLPSDIILLIINTIRKVARISRNTRQSEASISAAAVTIPLPPLKWK